MLEIGVVHKVKLTCFLGLYYHHTIQQFSGLNINIKKSKT
jgi:hypothetical protein